MPFSIRPLRRFPAPTTVRHHASAPVKKHQGDLHSQAWRGFLPWSTQASSGWERDAAADGFAAIQQNRRVPVRRIPSEI
jgi:hypothetical protein